MTILNVAIVTLGALITTSNTLVQSQVSLGNPLDTMQHKFSELFESFSPQSQYIIESTNESAVSQYITEGTNESNSLQYGAENIDKNPHEILIESLLDKEIESCNLWESATYSCDNAATEAIRSIMGVPHYGPKSSERERDNCRDFEQYGIRGISTIQYNFLTKHPKYNFLHHAANKLNNNKFIQDKMEKLRICMRNLETNLSLIDWLKYIT